MTRARDGTRRDARPPHRLADALSASARAPSCTDWPPARPGPFGCPVGRHVAILCGREGHPLRQRQGAHCEARRGGRVKEALERAASAMIGASYKCTGALCWRGGADVHAALRGWAMRRLDCGRSRRRETDTRVCWRDGEVVWADNSLLCAIRRTGRCVPSPWRQ
jgi:hypothetical protein